MGDDALDYPFIPAKNFTPLPNREIRWLVVHTMESPEKPDTATGTARYFADMLAPKYPAPKASAHFCIDRDHVIQCVRLKDIAWGAPGANRYGIHLEHAGYAKQTPEEWEDDYSQAMLLRSAGLTALLCARFSIPVVKLYADDLKAGQKGICGHADCSEAFEGGRGHTDPGHNFPWDSYLFMVKEAMGNA